MPAKPTGSTQDESVRLADKVPVLRGFELGALSALLAFYLSCDR
jgi:hypothetical protein